MPAIIVPPTVSPPASANPSANPTNYVPFVAPRLTGLSFAGPGINAEWIAGIPEFDVPFASDPKQYSYKLLYLVKADAFRSMQVDAPGPYGGFHCGESNFRNPQPGMLAFHREFAVVPDTRSEFESYVYAYQTGAINDGEIVEVPKTVTSRVQFDYFRTNDVRSIQLPRAPRLQKIGGLVYVIGGYGGFLTSPYKPWEDGYEFLAEDAILRLWKGRIYERAQRFVQWSSGFNLIT